MVLGARSYHETQSIFSYHEMYCTMSYIVVIHVGQEIIRKQTPSLITTLGALICLGDP
jgi:hypothetical protein